MMLLILLLLDLNTGPLNNKADALPTDPARLYGLTYSGVPLKYWADQVAAAKNSTWSGTDKWQGGVHVPSHFSRKIHIGHMKIEGNQNF